MSNLDEIVEIFELLGDWEQRYEYLNDRGEQLQTMPKAYMRDEYKVKGCMSNVYIYAYRNEEEPHLVYFYGDCDTATIKGILSLLIDLCNGKTVEEIQLIDMDEIFERLNLAEHLSPNRHFGIYAIVELMKQQALQLTQIEV